MTGVLHKFQRCNGARLNNPRLRLHVHPARGAASKSRLDPSVLRGLVTVGASQLVFRHFQDGTVDKRVVSAGGTQYRVLDAAALAGKRLIANARNMTLVIEQPGVSA